MEWRDVLSFLVFGGLIFFMMRFGCGSHRHGGSGGHRGGCCGGSPAEKKKHLENGDDNIQTNGKDIKSEPAKKSCH